MTTAAEPYHAAVVINSTYGRTVLPVGTFVQPKVTKDAAAAAAAAYAVAASSANETSDAEKAVCTAA
jgi:hypothetical protein